MCEQCLSEYENPTDRRFHAQPNACERCGPSLSWHDGTGEKIVVDDVIDSGVAALKDGKIIALRGLGGFHLCADGCSEQAVETLRRRKHRPHKPLAIMVADLEAAARLCRLSQEEAATLQGPEHPIALLKPLPDSVLAANLAPAMNDIGVMLPYTPLHHLLFAHPDCPPALVMTSGNMSGEPICTSITDAIARLSPIADNFLLHNRDIVTRVDDSVVKKMAGATRLLRRARGYVPSPLLVPYELPDIIGCGGGLKSTFSLARGKTIFPSQHIGDLFNQFSFDFYLESIDNLKRLLRIEPAVAACDLHPDYLSTRHAESIGLPLYRIQHHHAHAVAVMAEAGVDISGHRCKHVDELKQINFDVVITVCDHAHESCPLFSAQTTRVHAGFADPPRLAREIAEAGGDEEAQIGCYRQVRDEIKAYIELLPALLSDPTESQNKNLS